MSGDKDPARGEVKASVALVVRGVTKKHTSRARCQLVRSSGGDVRITCTPEDMMVVVVRRGTEKSVVWSGSRGSCGQKAVEQVGGGVETLSPEARGQRPGSEGCARRRSSCESSAQPCRSKERYTDKTCAAEHPERGRKNGRWICRTHARCHSGRL